MLRAAGAGQGRESVVQQELEGWERLAVLSALEMRRLEAPVRDKPGIDQHQRRALHQDVREIGSDIK